MGRRSRPSPMRGRRRWAAAGGLATAALLLLLLRLLAGVSTGLGNASAAPTSPRLTPVSVPRRRPEASGRPRRGAGPRGPPVAFVKTHKTGSSTLQNILFRAAERRNLTLAFPRYTFQFAYPQPFSPAFAEPPPPGAAGYDLLLSHLRLEPAALRRLMPPGTVFLTILRDPVRTYRSVFHYYCGSVPAFQPLRNRSRPLAAFLRRPRRYYDPREPGNGLARNPMAFDLGLEAGGDPSGSGGAWQRELERLNRTFGLVLIAERFEESLLLARELLGLRLEELAFVPLNARRPGDEGGAEPQRCAAPPGLELAGRAAVPLLPGRAAGPGGALRPPAHEPGPGRPVRPAAGRPPPLPARGARGAGGDARRAAALAAGRRRGPGLPAAPGARRSPAPALPADGVAGAAVPRVPLPAAVRQGHARAAPRLSAAPLRADL
ncbi:galactose-3-O-sulfotransferase 3-like [Rhea pennata]|uniref:galactose-3-O-sulfotransferase 3-like n=1 Tax=Rhea pennata TaxID=8795 RepID=UPI002E272325